MRYGEKGKQGEEGREKEGREGKVWWVEAGVQWDRTVGKGRERRGEEERVRKGG